MGTVRTYEPGTPSWVDLSTPDIDGAAAVGQTSGAWDPSRDRRPRWPAKRRSSTWTPPRTGWPTTAARCSWGSSGGPGRGLTRPDLSEEAIRLTRLVDTALPTPETRALLALMLFHHARAAAREGPDGALVPLGEQDRTRWDGAAIAEANRLLAAAAAAAGDDPPGPYQLQAAIASVHANAARPEDTRWDDVARLYDGLIAVAPTPVFRLNRAVAYAMTAGPDVALAQVDALAGLDGFHLFHATRADLLRRLGRLDEAEGAYGTALALTTNRAERRHLERRISECRGPVS
jgi:RNA polymerase sigma-70 factor, ECF subfamily